MTPTVRMSIVLTQKLIWDVANLGFPRPSLAPRLGHDGYTKPSPPRSLRTRTATWAGGI
jgi:hypothetical protein